MRCSLATPQNDARRLMSFSLASTLNDGRLTSFGLATTLNDGLFWRQYTAV
jgi:hypothetical protein